MEQNVPENPDDLREPTAAQLDRDDAWFSLKHGAVSWIRQRAPGAMVGAIVGTLLAVPFVMPAGTLGAGLLLLSAIAGGWAGKELLGDFSFMLNHSEAVTHPKPGPVDEPQQTQQISQQEARAASIARINAANPRTELSENYHTTAVEQARASGTAVTPPILM